ncbi:MAG: peptide chain release factor aRF-1 [Candidatus Pacearchaeota archaeon]
MNEKFYEFKKIIEELEKYKGKHTELISLYIPAGQNIYSIIDMLTVERSMAENIKSKITRENVIDAIETIIRELKSYKKTPENGLVIFCGNVGKDKRDIRIWKIEPIEPLKIKIYHCNHTFLLDPLKEMLETKKDVFGLIVIDRKEATIGLLEGKNIKKLRHLTSGVPGKIRAGGQSALRFERLRENAALEFYRRVGESVVELFSNDNRIKGILIGGPGPTKNEFLKEAKLPQNIMEKIIGIKDIGYADEHGLKYLIEESQDILANLEIMEEKIALKKFFDALAKNRAVYGLGNVKKALTYGAVDKVFISEDMEKEIIEEIKILAENSGSEIKFISSETEEGIQFKNIGGIGAILRFKIE